MDVSLRDRALVRVALALVSYEECGTLYVNHMDWKEDDVVTRQKIEKLNLPAIFKDSLRGAVNVISYEIAEWLAHIRELCVPDVIPIGQRVLQFSATGAVDKIGTARNIVRETNINIHSRFEIACNYAMVPEINALWPLMELKHLPFTRFGGYVVKYWRRSLQDVLNKLHVSDVRCGLESSVTYESIRFFYRNMPKDSKAVVLFGIARKALYRHPDVIVFVLEELNDKERRVLYRKADVFAILETLGRWPQLKWFRRVLDDVNFRHYTKHNGERCPNFLRRCFHDVTSALCSYFHSESETMFIYFWEKCRTEVAREIQNAGFIVYEYVMSSLSRVNHVNAMIVVFNDVEEHRAQLFQLLFRLCVCKDQWVSRKDFGKFFPISKEEALDIRKQIRTRGRVKSDAEEFYYYLEYLVFSNRKCK